LYCSNAIERWEALRSSKYLILQRSRLSVELLYEAKKSGSSQMSDGEERTQWRGRDRECRFHDAQNLWILCIF
jgi:hypothetical protein